MDSCGIKRAATKVTGVAALLFMAQASAPAAAPGFYFAGPQSVVPQSAVHAEAPPFAGADNYGVRHQPFRWGWFGAEHFYPMHRSHQETMGDVMRWSRWRRY